LIQLAGFTVITDPVFGSISRMFARILEPGIALQNLPKIDAILISHNHRDHMDEKSLLALKAANPLVAVYVPLGNGEWFTRRGFAQVHECTWWESHTVGVASDVQVHCLPAIHWSRRGMFDRNKALWSSWLIKSPESTIYFAGDTAYGPHFKTIGESFKPIDMALMPIGPCEPHELMRHSHVSPEEAVRACADLQASVMIPMHWGTFKLGCDEPLDPLHRLRNVWRNSPELVAGKRCLVRPCGSVISLPIPPDISVETDLIASYSQADH
jgi:L-ascorbate metabolism protein UlaG (beta-lactamase superfamily)